MFYIKDDITHASHTRYETTPVRVRIVHLIHFVEINLNHNEKLTFKEYLTCTRQRKIQKKT